MRAGRCSASRSTRAGAVDQVRPHAVAQQVAAQDPVVALAVDRDREEAVSADAVPWSYPTLGWRPARRTPHERSRIAMQSTSNDSPWSVKSPVTRPGWSTCDPWLNGGSWRRQQRLAQGLEREVERQVVVVAPEPEHAAGLEALQPHAAVQVRGVEQVRRLGQRLVPAPLERGQLPRHRGGVVDHEHAAELDAHVRPERRDRSTRAGCARAPSTRTRRSPSTTGRRSRADGTDRPRGRDPSRRVASVMASCPPGARRTGVRWRSASAPIAERIDAVSRAA